MKKNILIILGTSLYFFSQTISTYAASYEYDDLGRVTKAVYEDGSSVTYVYDANGNIVETISVSGREESTGGGQTDEQNPEDNSGEAGEDPGRIYSDHTDINHEDAGEKETQDFGGETAKEENEGNGGEGSEKNKDGTNADESHKEDEIESWEGNENAKKDADAEDAGSIGEKIAGSIIGAVAAAMGFVWALLWKKHTKETKDNEVGKGGE